MAMNDPIGDRIGIKLSSTPIQKFLHKGATTDLFYRVIRKDESELMK
jgi:hypothetical protein